MANVVYVGNYPNTLSDEDILEIFQDFEGLVLLRSIKKNRKCYSFILCQDQEQVLEVVFALNGFCVGGRNLIVRASDDELQGIIDQCEYEDDYDAPYSSPHSIENNPEASSTNYRQPRKPSRLASAKVTLNSFSHVERLDSKDYEKDACCGASIEGNDSVILDRGSTSGASYFETACSFKTSRKNRSLSPCSVASSSSSYRKRKGEKFSFVSIVNFPDGTTIEELEEMFEDYNPFKIIIQNQISDVGRPTEAVICFLKVKDATSSIINLDNTLYHGRVILVTECGDTALITSLMTFHQH